VLGLDIRWCAPCPFLFSSYRDLGPNFLTEELHQFLSPRSSIRPLLMRSTGKKDFSLGSFACASFLGATCSDHNPLIRKLCHVICFTSALTPLYCYRRVALSSTSPSPFSLGYPRSEPSRKRQLWRLANPRRLPIARVDS